MFTETCDFNENLWERIFWWIWTVIKSNRKRLQLEEHHKLNHISSTTCQSSREHWETSRDWKSQQTLTVLLCFVKFFADGDEDLEPDTWSPIGIWRASLITIVQQMPSSQFGQTRRPSNWDNWSLAAESNSQYYNQIVTVLMTISVASSFGFIFGTLLTTNCLGCPRCSEKRRRGEGNILSGNCCDHYPWPLLATAGKTTEFLSSLSFTWPFFQDLSGRLKSDHEA